MQINRDVGSPIIVGKRVTFGAIIGGIVATASFIWDAMNPENPLPAPVVIALTTTLTGIFQIWLVQKYGVTGA